MTTKSALQLGESGKPLSTLACIPCQHAKVKCDRGSPCTRCIKRSVDCTQASHGPRKRRRRFGEGALLTRIRHYEGLLRSNGIRFEPLHPASERPDHEKTSTPDSGVAQMSIKAPSPADTDAPYGEYEDSEDDASEQDILDLDARRKISTSYWNINKDNDYLLLFGAQSGNEGLASLHPSQAHIFKLWQTFLENVDPLLKVIHPPTLQPTILEAATNLQSVEPVTEALMFSIYCMAILSLTTDECMATYGAERDTLLLTYQYAAQQALLKSRILQTDDRHCLTAFYLYLISVRGATDARSLSSMLGCAVRIAQRLGYDCERSVQSSGSILEDEMRRRLWWSLMSFDSRQYELSDYKSPARVSKWDCKLPMNVNDSELRPALKSPPSTYGRATDTLFALVRAEMTTISQAGTTMHDLNYPNAQTTSKAIEMDQRLHVGTQSIETNYLRYCDDQNPLHYMTMWTARAFMAKNRVIEHLAAQPRASQRVPTEQRNTTINYALYMLQCDTKLAASPLTKGYHWYAEIYFPGFAYIQAAQSLRQQPLQDNAARAWAIMSDNYQHRFLGRRVANRDLVRAFASIIVQAWEARVALVQAGHAPLLPPLHEPMVVAHSKRRLAEIPSLSNTHERSVGPLALVSAPLSAAQQDPLLGVLAVADAGSSSSVQQPHHYGITPLPEQDMYQFDWSLLDWTSMDI